MHPALIVIASLTLLIWVELLVDAARGRGDLTFLRRVEPYVAADSATIPAVSVVVAACNEERRIEAAVRSMLALDYHRLQVVAVDDRSTDGTGAILDRLGHQDPRLRVIHIVDLPPGWLGKTHALQVGSQAASGELLLFTDADVVFEPSALSRAVRWMNEHRVDHLAGATDVHASGLWLPAFVSAFALFFCAYFRPWRAVRSDPRWYVGFGGFNLVRRSAYEAIGGHAAVAFDPLDDVNLGRALKARGFSQQCAVLGGLASVEWYPTLGAAIRGLEKNTMAGASWSFARLILGVVGQVVVAVWPFAALLATDGWLWWINAAVVAAVIGICAGMVRETTLPAWAALLFPFAVLLVAFTHLRAAFLTHRRGGIEWRGTFYSLDDLRACR